MTLTGIGPLWLYRSIFSLFSITTKGKQADESLTRLYICKYKTLLINRAGKHHRGFYPSSYPRNCSLVIFNKLDTLNFITQSISLRGFFSLQLKYTNYSLLVIQFSLDNKSRGMSSYQLVLEQFVCFYQLTCHLCCKMLAHFASLLTWHSLQFLSHSFLSSRTNVEKHPMAGVTLHFVLSPFTFCILVGLTKHVHEYETRPPYWEPFGCLAFETEKSKQQHPRNPATPRNPTHSNGNFWMAKSSVQFEFLIGCFKQFLKMNVSM